MNLQYRTPQAIIFAEMRIEFVVSRRSSLAGWNECVAPRDEDKAVGSRGGLAAPQLVQVGPIWSWRTKRKRYGGQKEIGRQIHRGAGWR